MVPAGRSPRLVKHRAAEVPEFIRKQEKAEVFPKKPRGDDLLHASKHGLCPLSACIIGLLR